MKIKKGDYIRITADYLLKLSDDFLINRMRIRLDIDYEVLTITANTMYILDEDGKEVRVDKDQVTLSTTRRRNETIDTILS